MNFTDITSCKNFSCEKFGLAVLAFLISIVVTGCQSKKNLSQPDSSPGQQVPSIVSKNHTLDGSIPRSSSFISDYKPYIDSVEQYRETRLTTTERDLFLNKPEGSLNNLLADMLRWHASRIRGNQIDVGFIPYNLMQDTLWSGPVRIGDMYRIIPRDRKMVLYKVNGHVLRRITEVIAAEGGGAVSGLRMTLDPRGVHDVLVGSQPLKHESWYGLIAPAGIFCLEEKGQLVGLRGNNPQCNSKQASDLNENRSVSRGFVRARIPIHGELRDIIIQYMNDQIGLNGHRDNRIRILK